MASKIAHAIRDAGVFVCEAGTGTGKTVAYLVPALLSGAKVIISTGTKPLQDQLFRRDLPMVREALGIPVTAALLKGRANYVCHHHLERNLHDGRLPDRDAVAHLQQIVRFAKQTKSGDRSDFPEVPEDAFAWSLAGALGRESDSLQWVAVASLAVPAMIAVVAAVRRPIKDGLPAS